MILKSLELQDFRNYRIQALAFDDRVNIIYGKNAQGKTNLLEAAYLCCTSKSYKGSPDREMIRFDCEESHIKTVVQRQNDSQRIDIHLRKGARKVISINKTPVKRAADLLGILNIIFFSPEDLNIIKSSPQRRRSFMDTELCQLDRIYLSDLGHYNRILTQRGQLLKDMYYHPELKETLDVWDAQLVDYGSRIIERRKEFLEELAPVILDMHYRISGKREELRISYECSATAEDFADKIRRSRDRDEKLAQTTVGPHRDDILFMIGGVDVRKFGSQGQQRTCALSLKLSEIYLVGKRIHDTPILLLDDVLSELDSQRQNLLLDNLNRTQTIITCTGMDEFVKNRFSVDKVFEVVDGNVTEK